MTIEIYDKLLDINRAYHQIRVLQETIILSHNNENLKSAGYELEKVIEQLEDYIEEQDRERSENYEAICENARKEREATAKKLKRKKEVN